MSVRRRRPLGRGSAPAPRGARRFRPIESVGIVVASGAFPLTTQFGALLVIGNVLLDQLGVPIPAAPALIVAGAIAVEHPAWGVELLVGAVLACLVADSLWYLSGRAYGSRVMRLLCRISITPDSCVNDTYSRFERWGDKAILAAKFVPGLAVITPPLAGATQMAWGRFTALTSVAATLWVGAYLLAGMLFKPQIDWLLPRIGSLGGPAAMFLGALFGSYLGVRFWQRQRFYRSMRMARISVSELYERLQSPAVPVVIDVRAQSARDLDPRRIPGAMSVPLAEVDRHLGALPRDREIILYCTCPNEASAARTAKVLMKHGFMRVRPLHGGLDAWVEAGYRVDRFTAPEGADA